MKVVIEISEEEYKRMKEKKMFGNVTVWKNAICNGTPLPKGHGRLVDVSEYFKKEFGDARKFLDNATTIIEADGGGKNEVSD